MNHNTLSEDDIISIVTNPYKAHASRQYNLEIICEVLSDNEWAEDEIKILKEQIWSSLN
jgi:hypothetical protein